MGTQSTWGLQERNEIIFCIINEISFTIISLSSSDKFFLESRFFIRSCYYITNYHRNLLCFLIREVLYGWCLRYFHSSGASFVFLFLFLHLGRAMFYGSYFYNPNTWFSGILLLFFLMAIAFMGYVLPFGQMSFWGATVITNLLSPFPSLVEWICGGYCVHNPTLKRFFLFHFLFPFLLCGFVILHLFYLHFLSSNNPLRNSTNNKIPFFPFIFILCLYFLQTHFGISSLSHPDNALEACALLTP